MIPFFDEAGTKHSLKTVGKKLVFSINDLLPDDAGLYQVDVEDVNLFTTDFKSKDMFSPLGLAIHWLSNCIGYRPKACH